MEKIKVLSLFTGIGAFEKALKNIEIDFEVVGYSEISPAASKAYSAIHNTDESLNYGDIKKIDENNLPEFDMMSWSFPCVGFSIARRDKELQRTGLNNEDSGLYYEGLKILKRNKPMLSVIENVPDLISSKFKNQFDSIIEDINNCGYTSHFAVLNGQDFNIPQSRSRLFIISIRNDIYKGYEFPSSVPLTKKAADYLEDIENIEEKFLKINPSIIEKVKSRNIRDFNICPTITKAIGRGGSSSEYIANCALIYKNTGIMRRMTPKETMLFTGFTEDDYNSAKAVTSDTQIFNFSGNSICVPVLEHIFYNLFLKFGYKDIVLKSRTAQISNNQDSFIPRQLKFDLF